MHRTVSVFDHCSIVLHCVYICQVSWNIGFDTNFDRTLADTLFALAGEIHLQWILGRSKLATNSKLQKFTVNQP